MKRSDLETSYKKRIEDLYSKIQLAQAKKKEIIEYVKRLTLLHHKSKITNEQYNKEIYRYLKGQSYDEWLNYYDDYINECHKKIIEYNKITRKISTEETLIDKLANKALSPYVVIFIILASSFGFFLFTGTTPFEPTGLVFGNVSFNQTDSYLRGNNLSDVNITLELKTGDHIFEDANITITLVNEDNIIQNISSMNLTDFIANSTIPNCWNRTTSILWDVDNAWNWEGISAYGFSYNGSAAAECNDGVANSNVYDVNLRWFFLRGAEHEVPSEVGVYNITMNVTNQSAAGNEQVAYSTQMFLVGNPGPKFEAIDNITLIENFAAAIELNLSDNVTDELESDADINYTVEITNSSIISAEFDLMNGTGNITFRSIANQFGSTDVNITAIDGNGTGGSNSTYFFIDITNVNDNPVFEPVSNFAVDEDFATAIELNLSDNVSDLDDPDSSMLYTVVMTDSSVITAEFDLMNGTGNLTFRAAVNISGATDINVTTYDTGGLTNDTLFTLTVNPINDPPGIADIADFSANEDFDAFEINISDNLTDADDPLTDINYTILNSDISVVTAEFDLMNGTGNLTFRFVANATGSSLITVTAIDNNGTGLTAQDTFTLTINAINDNPLFNDIGNFSIAEDSQLQELNISLNISDVEDPHRDLNYTIFENNSLFLILAVENGTGNFTYQPNGNATGTTTINITVIDSNGTGLIESDTFDLTINSVNDKPLFDAIADIDLDANFAAFELNLSDNVTDVEDPDSQLNYTVENNNTVALITEFDLMNGTGNLTIRAVQDIQNTNATINITVYDQNGEAGYEIESDEFIITIGSITNVAPEITFLSANVNDSFNPLEGDIRNIEFSLIVNDSDGDADIGNVTANFTQGNLLRENVTMCISDNVEQSLTDTFSVNFSCTIGLQYFDPNGDYVINVETNDSQGVTAINNTLTLTYNLLTAMNLSVNALTLATADPDEYNITNSSATDFLNIENTGNQAGLNLSVNASDLGNVNTIFTIPAENFTFANISIDYDGLSKAECMDSTLDGNQTTNLVNATLTQLTGIIDRGAAQSSSLYLCLVHVPAGIPGVSYTTDLGGSWSLIVAPEP